MTYLGKMIDLGTIQRGGVDSGLRKEEEGAWTEDRKLPSACVILQGSPAQVRKQDGVGSTTTQAYGACRCLTSLPRTHPDSLPRATKEPTGKQKKKHPGRSHPPIADASTSSISWYWCSVGQHLYGVRFLRPAPRRDSSRRRLLIRHPTSAAGADNVHRWWRGAALDHKRARQSALLAHS